MNAARNDPAVGNWPLFFLIAGAYDIVLGLPFLVAGESILEGVGMVLPPHIAYIHLPAIFIIVQGVSYLLVARNPWHNVGLVWVGVLYKASYVALAAWYLATNQMPSLFFVPWAVADVVFLVFFLAFIRAAGSRGRA